MRLCEKQEDLLPLLKQASQEAQAAFGNGACYIERAIRNPRHIEFQVGVRCVGHLCTRECVRVRQSVGVSGYVRADLCGLGAGSCAVADKEWNFF